MSTEQVRSNFEKSKPGSLTKWNNGNYVSEIVQSMWIAYQQAWMDSRTELTVDLPDMFKIEMGDYGCAEFLSAIEVKSSLRAAGITVRDE